MEGPVRYEGAKLHDKDIEKDEEYVKRGKERLLEEVAFEQKLK